MVFIPNLYNASLKEANLFNTDNVVNYIYNAIVYEYEPLGELITLEIKDNRYSNNAFINAKINIDSKIIKSDFYINLYNLEDEINNKIPLSSISNDFIYTFHIDDPGVYSIEVLSEFDNLTFNSNKKYLAISDFDIESELLYQNKKSIHNFKNQNNATYFEFKDLENNLNNIRRSKIIDVKLSNLNSLSTQPYWIFFIFLFAIEWYLRKKSKLL